MNTFYLVHCNNIYRDTARFGNTYDDFTTDGSFHDSVCMSLMQIGELSNKLSDEFKDSTRQQIPWKQIYNMRNHFAHGYDVMDESKIWGVVTVDIPVLKLFCETVLNEIDSNLDSDNKNTGGLANSNLPAQ